MPRSADPPFPRRPGHSAARIHLRPSPIGSKRDRFPEEAAPDPCGKRRLPGSFVTLPRLCGGACFKVLRVECTACRKAIV